MFPRSVGSKSYELTDHLGNVKAVVSDRKKLSDEVREYRYSYGFENSNDVPSEAWSGWSFSTEHVYRGSQSVKVTGFGHLFRMAVEPGDTVSAEAMMKFVSGTTGSHIYLAFQDENGQNEVGVGSEERDLPSHQHVNEWFRIEHPPTVVPAGKYSVLVYLRKRSEHSEAWFDDFKISVKRGYAEPVLSAEVLSANSYYAFGSLMPKRSFNSSGYRYGFNGMEKDDEVKGGGKTYTTEFRQYDAQLGRWWSVDPLAHIVPGWTPYRAFFNNPIYWTDSHGNIEWPLKGTSAQNKADAPGGGFGLTNTVIRTSTYQEIRSVGTSPHIGIDYRAAIGTPVYSLGDGEVTGKSTTASGIIILEVRYGGETGDKIRFLHLNEYAEGIEVGSKVKEGQIIAYTGNSGGYPAHLHIDGKDSEGNSIDPEAKNYGRFTNEEFFGKYDGDYTKLPSSNQEAGTSKGKPTYSAPGWAKNSLIGAHIYFIFTGKDPSFSDQENEELLRMREGTD